MTENSKLIVENAITIQDQISRYLLVTEKYKQKGYLQDVSKIQVPLKVEDILLMDDYLLLHKEISSLELEILLKGGAIVNDGSIELFLDKYHWNSVQFTAKFNTDTVGSARLITKASFGLPTLTESRIKLFDDYKFVHDELCGEFSQFVVRDGRYANASAGLIKLAYQYSITQLQIFKWVATIDNSVLKLLNSRFYNFNLPAIGPSIEYLGSTCTPVYIDLNASLENSVKFESSRLVAEFILGRGNKGFEDVYLN